MRPMHHIYAMIICLMVSSCQRRELSYDDQYGVPVRVDLDWSELGSQEQPLYVKALFFPVGGGETVERYIEYRGQQVNIPEGKYNIIIYTWRTNADEQTVQFRGDTYDTFEAYTEKKALRMTVKGSTKSVPVVPEPDEVYYWNSGDDPVIISSDKATVQGQSLPMAYISASMKSGLKYYQFEVNVRDADQMGYMFAILTNVYNSRSLGSDRCTGKSYNLFSDNISVIAEQDGLSTYKCIVATFSFCEQQNNFIININNKDGRLQQKTVDITQHIENVDNGLVDPDQPIVVIEKENPIVVDKTEIGGEGGGGFIPPSLGDWDEEDKEIEI